MIHDIIASIVLYNNDKDIITKTINSFLSINLNKKIILIDNSESDKLEYLKDLGDEIVYYKNVKNIGFGKAHNIAIEGYLKQSKYFLVLNPDIYFDGKEVERMIGFLNDNEKYGLLLPKVLYPNGSIQHLCKRNPTFLDLFIRRFIPKLFTCLFKKRMDRFEYKDHDYNNIIENVPYLSGCFMLFRSKVLGEIGNFDDKIFMYIEDADITRRVLKVSNTIYYPHAFIYHHFAKGSHKKIKLLLFSIHGAFVYFNKWGWRLY